MDVFPLLYHMSWRQAGVHVSTVHREVEQQAGLWISSFSHTVHHGARQDSVSAACSCFVVEGRSLGVFPLPASELHAMAVCRSLEVSWLYS